MRKFLLTTCTCLLFASGYAQEPVPTFRKGLFGRGQKSEQKTDRRAEPRAEGKDEQQTPRPESSAGQPAQSAAPGQTTAPVKAAKISGAHLNMPAPTYDFGDAPRKGGDLTHEFRFTNDGTAPLVITRVITSCSCLKASFPKRPVAPGDSGVISIRYEPHKSEPGAFNKVIQIYSNSVDGRDVITVQGNSIDGELSVKVKAGGTKIKVK